MNSLEIIPSISKYLARLSEEVTILNTIDEFSINTRAENALIEVFNHLFKANFQNVNKTKRRNYPSIDLLDEEVRIGIQVTASNDLKKIKDCLEKYFSNSIWRDVDKLYIYILTEKQARYDQKKIDSLISQLKVDYPDTHNHYDFRFITHQHIIDKRDLILLINDLEVPILKKIEFSLKREFDNIEFSNDLSSYYQKIKLGFLDVVMNDVKGMSLKDIYIEPKFQVNQMSVVNDKKENRSNSEVFLDVDYESLHLYLNQFFFKCLKDKEIIQSNIILLLGYPGQGKTSFCKKVIYDFLNSKTKNSKELFYFRLKDIRQVRSLLYNPLATLNEEASLITGIEVDKHIFRKSVIILDGLDELFMKEDLKLDDIERICKELIRESEKFRDLRIIITTRYGYVDLDKLRNESIQIFKLSSLNYKQQKNWLSKFTVFHQDTWLNDKHLKLIHSQKKSQKESYLKELLEQPLLLHIVASLKEEVGLNVNRSEIYDKLFTELIDRKYSSEGQIEILKLVSKDQLRELIQEVAFAIFLTGNGYIGKKELIINKAVQSYLANLPNTDFKENIKGVMISFYFKESQIHETVDSSETNYVIEFIHKSLQEYMVAEKIARTLMWTFRNKDLKNTYLINNSDLALQVVYELFANRYLTIEIRTYFFDILSAYEITEKNEVVNRLQLFFDDFCKKDFLCTINRQFSISPLNNIFNTFSGVWMTLTTLDPKNNNLRNFETRQKVAVYITVIENHFARIADLSLSYQDFSESSLNSTWGIGRQLVQHTKFVGTEMFHAEFIDCLYYNCNFNNSELINVFITDCRFEECDFTFTNCYQIVLDGVEFIDVNFANASLEKWIFKDVKFIKSKPKHFYGTEMTMQVLIELIKFGAEIKIDKLGQVTESRQSEILSLSQVNDILVKEFPDIDFG